MAKRRPLARSQRVDLHASQFGSGRNADASPLHWITNVDNGGHGQSKQALQFGTATIVSVSRGEQLHRRPLIAPIQPFIFDEIHKVLAVAG
jgi:hypothetical protein